MINPTKNEKTIGITGASGALGKELTKLFRQNGYKVIGFTHSKTNYEINLESPNEWIKWECGKESSLKKQLEKIDILILNFWVYYLRIKFDIQKNQKQQRSLMPVLKQFQDYQTFRPQLCIVILFLSLLYIFYHQTSIQFLPSSQYENCSHLHLH